VSSTNSFTKGTCTAFSVQRINEQSFTCSQRLTSHEVLLLPVSRTRHRSNALFTDSSRRWVRESRAARGREPKIMHTGASCGLAASLHPKRKEHTYCASLCYFTLARTEIPMEATVLLPCTAALRVVSATCFLAYPTTMGLWEPPDPKPLSFCYVMLPENFFLL
jgi:hypothetical protein